MNEATLGIVEHVDSIPPQRHWRLAGEVGDDGRCNIPTGDLGPTIMATASLTTQWCGAVGESPPTPELVAPAVMLQPRGEGRGSLQVDRRRASKRRFESRIGFEQR